MIVIIDGGDVENLWNELEGRFGPGLFDTTITIIYVRYKTNLNIEINN